MDTLLMKALIKLGHNSGSKAKVQFLFAIYFPVSAARWYLSHPVFTFPSLQT